ncbi:hypothetical protein IQ273_08600 [Nodosilinea sp. LEGE 07298]|uniref:hypothetical protein n=1 Tax=Nodosilinea sp. LEGE 07298 TaxID=2777970 RepID=UPI0018821494|nr:hypothetical protein [Nodosilinea sp. LEGE 07298]MBE9109473.1 hypothetical protein [Nodosilinea sp. LEGE 07298]
MNLALPQAYPDLDMVKNSYALISGVLTVTCWIGADPTAFKLSHPCPLLQLTQACLKSFVMSFVDIRQRTISIIEHPPQNKLEAVIQLLEVLAEPVHQASMPPEYDRVPQRLRREVSQRAQHLVR